MSAGLLPMEEVEIPHEPTSPQQSLMTSIGLVEGEALTYLEAHGHTALRRLVRELEWPSPMTMMAVGALIRQGLIRAKQHDLEVMLEVIACPESVDAARQKAVPEFWGGSPLA